MADYVPGQNNQNFKKKIDYKLFFMISFSVNVVLLYLLYFLYTVPLEIKVGDLVKQNKATYDTLIKIKTSVN